MNKKLKKGFTLIELACAAASIGLIFFALAYLWNFSSQQQKRIQHYLNPQTSHLERFRCDFENLGSRSGYFEIGRSSNSTTSPTSFFSFVTFHFPFSDSVTFSFNGTTHAPPPFPSHWITANVSINIGGNSTYQYGRVYGPAEKLGFHHDKSGVLVWMTTSPSTRFMPIMTYVIPGRFQ